MSEYPPFFELLDGSIVREQPKERYKGIWRQMPTPASRYNPYGTGKSWYWQSYSFYSVNENPSISVNDRDIPKTLQLLTWLRDGD